MYTVYLYHIMQKTSPPGPCCVKVERFRQAVNICSSTVTT